MLNYLRQHLPLDFPPRVWFHQLTGWLAALSYGFPAGKMRVIAVTGTNGKTTTVNLIAHLLHEAGFKVGMASTANFRINEEVWANESHKTTLGRFGLQKLIRRMNKAGVTHLVLEVSSHALCQGRIMGIPIDMAIFTNLEAEHLDYHRTLERYKLAKGKLFAKLKSSRVLTNAAGEQVPKVSIVNYDDPFFSYYHDFPADQKFVYSLKELKNGAATGLWASDIQTNLEQTTFKLHNNKLEKQLTIPLSGAFNVANTLAAVAAARALDIPMETIKKALLSFHAVSGRLERIEKNGVSVVIDYAVTPDSFKLLFQTLRPMCSGKLISVFGATGDRDRGKRPYLGQVAGELTDMVVVTDEEPYFEDPDRVRKEIIEGLKKTKKIKDQTWFEIPDRRAAIEFALSKAVKGDIITLTGLGHQTSVVYAEKNLKWSDQEEVRKLLSQKKE